MSNSAMNMINEIRRLRLIKRCNNNYTINAEDVAQHSYYATMLAWCFASEYNQYAAEHNANYHPLDCDNLFKLANVDAIIKRSLCHDVPESLTSDIIYNVKNNNENIKNAVNEVEQSMVFSTFSNSIFGTYIANVSLVPCLEFEENFVKLGDICELAIYCMEEIKMGNSYACEMLSNCKDIILNNELFGQLCVNNLSPTLSDICGEIEVILNKN